MMLSTEISHLGQTFSETPNEYNFKGRLFSPLKIESFENGLVKKKQIYQYKKPFRWFVKIA